MATMEYIYQWLSHLLTECPASVKEMWEMGAKHGAETFALAQVRHLAEDLKEEMED